jgi:ketol-acid reductoisomerase
MNRALPASTSECMAEALEEIRDGSFAREWEREQAAGYPVFTRLKQAAFKHAVNDLEAKLKELLSGGR